MELHIVVGLCFMVGMTLFLVGLFVGVSSASGVDEKSYKAGWRDGKTDKPRNLTANDAWMLYEPD